MPLRAARLLTSLAVVGAAAAAVVLLLVLPETSSSNILYRRAKRLRKVTGNDKLRTKGEIFSASLTGKELALMTFVRPFVLSFTQPIVLGINFHIGKFPCVCARSKQKDIDDHGQPERLVPLRTTTSLNPSHTTRNTFCIPP